MALKRQQETFDPVNDAAYESFTAAAISSSTASLEPAESR
jgi:hypothetical protein